MIADFVPSTESFWAPSVVGEAAPSLVADVGAPASVAEFSEPEGPPCEPVPSGSAEPESPVLVSVPAPAPESAEFEFGDVASLAPPVPLDDESAPVDVAGPSAVEGGWPSPLEDAPPPESGGGPLAEDGSLPLEVVDGWAPVPPASPARSEERRVGKECPV